VLEEPISALCKLVLFLFFLQVERGLLAGIEFWMARFFENVEKDLKRRNTNVKPDGKIIEDVRCQSLNKERFALTISICFRTINMIYSLTFPWQNFDKVSLQALRTFDCQNRQKQEKINKRKW
jgi:hypothetical protein